MIRSTLLAISLLMAVPPLAATAQDTSHHDHMAMGGQSEAMQGYIGAMDGMMQSMPMESSGDPDADFLLMMIPHHQSAIDMARVELEHGKDEETRAMAQAIIEAQEKEIAQMRAMLGRMGVDVPAP